MPHGIVTLCVNTFKSDCKIISLRRLLLWFEDRTRTHTISLKRLPLWFEEETPTHTHDIGESAAAVV